jgi:EAL domain-containing protein (putative c-di-GMP-specific phosphodiesterase class I)
MLEDQQYVTYAQPIVSADGNWDSVGNEMLFRELDQNGNLIPPDTIFGAAKDAQLLFKLDQIARINAVKTASSIGGQGDVFINFIPGSVYDPSVCLKSTIEAAKTFGVPPNRIVIEIVESHQIDDIDHLRNVVTYFREAGFRMALDDFGTGFNNLNMYIALDPDFVKLDKSVTSNLTDSDPRVATVKGIVRAAHSSGIKVIAEGIETAANARVVSDCGVDCMQGYFFGYPTPILGNAA